MWPFNRRRVVARQALGLPLVIAEAIDTDTAKIIVEEIRPNTTDIAEVMSVGYHLKLAEKMTAQITARREMLTTMIAAETATHTDNVSAEIDNHKQAMKNEADRHEREAARLAVALDHVEALAKGYEGLSAVLVPPPHAVDPVRLTQVGERIAETRQQEVAKPRKTKARAGEIS